MEFIVRLVVGRGQFDNVKYTIIKSTAIGSFVAFQFDESEQAQAFFNELRQTLPLRRFSIIFDPTLNRQEQTVPVQDATLDTDTNTVEIQTTIKL